MLTAAEVLNRTQHRPWPLPSQPWLMTLSWKRLLFAHWPVDVQLLQSMLPKGLTLDTFEDQAWIGVVPFKMGVRLRYSPWAFELGELNVRTYVTCQNKPGVFFFSLDASDLFTVVSARQTYSLPYYWAKIQIDEQAEVIQYVCERTNNPQAAFTGSYRPTGPVFQAAEHTLDHWLTERYCLYSVDPKGNLFRGNVQHEPWPLQPAEATIERNTMALPAGIHLPDRAPLLHYAHHIDVVAWPLEKVGKLTPASF